MHERRKAQRFPIEQPVRLTFTSAGHYELEAVSRDVSNKGVFVYVEAEIKKDSEIEMVLGLPAENGSIPVKIRGRVVRVEQVRDGKQGAGIAFEKIEILPG